NGNQIDLYAELTSELHVHRLVVECKDISEEVGIEQVRQLHTRVDSVTSKSQPVQGLLVSRSGFTRTAKALAGSLNIQLLELKDLERLSFDPFSVASYVLNSFERDELKQVYVDLSCQVNEGGSGTIYKPVEKFLDMFLSSTKRLGVAVLGNFGSGKSSL